MDKITKKVLTFSVTAKPEWFTSIFESWTVEVMTDAAEVSPLLKLQGLPGVPSAYRPIYLVIMENTESGVQQAALIHRTGELSLRAPV